MVYLSDMNDLDFQKIKQLVDQSLDEKLGKALQDQEGRLEKRFATKDD